MRTVNAGAAAAALLRRPRAVSLQAHGTRGRARAFARANAAFTIVEMLIALAMFAVLLIGTLALFDASSRSALNESERSTALSETTTGFSRMTREISTAYQINGPTSGTESDWVDFLIRPKNGTDYRVIYNCNVTDPTNAAFKACIRYQVLYQPATGLTTAAGTVPAGATKSVVIPRVINRTASDAGDYVFKSLTSPQGSGTGDTYGSVSIRTPSRGEAPSVKGNDGYKHDLVITGSFYIRQLDFGH